MPGDKEYAGHDGSVKSWKFTPGVDSVVSVLDKRHFMYGKVNTQRYELEAGSDQADRNLALAESIKEHGVEQPGVIWWHNDIGHIISGTRRWTGLEIANGLREAEKLPVFSMRFEVNSRWDETIAREKWRRANQDQDPNDLLTRLEGAALDVERGVAIEKAAKAWDFKPAQLRRAIEAGGVLDATPSLKEALAADRLSLPAALRLCKLPNDEQRKALQGKSEKTTKAPASVSVVKLRKVLDAFERGDSPAFGMSAVELLQVLTDENCSHDGAPEIKSILTERAKPGPKTKEAPKHDGLTQEEREGTQRMLDAHDAEKKRAAAEKAEAA